MANTSLDKILSIVVKPGGREINKIEIPVKEYKSLYSIGRSGLEVKVYNIENDKAIESLNIQDLWVSRYNPEIGKYGSIFIYVAGDNLKVMPAPNTKNSPKIDRIEKNHYRVKLGYREYIISLREDSDSTQYYEI